MFRPQLATFTTVYFVNRCILLQLRLSVVKVITYLLIYSMEEKLFLESNLFPANRKFPAFYGKRNFITAFTRAPLPRPYP